MTQPTPYTPAADFSADELANVGGRSTVRTAALDAELQGIATNLDGLNANIELIQRDDGQLRDGVAKLHTLAADVKALLVAGQGLPRGNWVTATAYALRDLVVSGGDTFICAIAHTSGTFATDKAAGRWLLFALGTTAAASAVPFTPTGNIAATNVQAAIEESDTEIRASVALLSSNLANTASGKGTDLIGHFCDYLGGVGRLLSLKLSDWVTFHDFGAVGDGVTDDTVAVQKAIDAMAGIGGGYVTGVPGKTYKITAALLLKSRVRIDLQTALVLQFTDNTPIFKATPSGAIQSWGISNGRLRFNTQQVSTQTSAVGVQLADGQLSYDWYLMDLRIERACDGVMCPPTTGSFAFVGRCVNVIADSCARWALNIDCDSLNGANTNIQFVNCWALQPSGAAISTSKGFRFNALSMGCFESLFSDYIQGTFVEATNCDGRFGMLTMEASTITANNTQIALVQFSECSGSIETLKLVSNTLTATGTGEIYMIRATTSGVQTMAIGNFVAQTNTYSGGTAIYEINPTAGMTFSVRRAKLDRTANFVDPDAHAPRIVEWDGRPRIGRGTTAQRPTLTANARGVEYLDTTLAAAGKPIKWTGTVWVDGLGAAV